jgi:hypothetical protein
MQKLKELPKIPRLCDDRGRAYSRYKGIRHYFGVTGSEKAKERYRKFVIDLLNGHLPITREDKAVVTSNRNMLVSELCAAFLKYYSLRLCKSHIVHFNYAIPFLVELYGDMSADAITPKKMRDVRDRMVESGRFCRSQINNYTARLIRVFVWGAGEDYIDGGVAGALKMIQHLPKGEPCTFDNPKRRNVSDEIIRRTLQFLSTTVAGNRDQLHETQTPVALLRQIIRSYSKPGDIIIDPCFGSGTTIVAAMLEGRRVVGIEMKKSYFNKAVGRATETYNALQQGIISSTASTSVKRIFHGQEVEINQVPHLWHDFTEWSEEINYPV